MLKPNDPYILISFISATIILIMGCCLLGFVVPANPELKNYRISRRFLACAFIVLSMAGFSETLIEFSPVTTQLTYTLVLSIASFQTILFTFSLITLIDISFVKARRILFHFIPVILLSAILLVCLFHAPLNIYYIVFGISTFLYCLQLIHYIYLFNREYKKYRDAIDNYYADNSNKRLKWINSAFYMALSIGVMSLFSMINLTVLSVFTIIYTTFYVYFAIKYLSYINTFHYISPALIPEINEDIPIDQIHNSPLAERIEQWVAEKKFTDEDVNLDSLARTLHTNRTYLSRHINTYMHASFKTWISRLRIEEAVRLMNLHPGQSTISIAEAVGITNKSSFFRQFLQITGKTPGEYRKNKT